MQDFVHQQYGQTSFETVGPHEGLGFGHVFVSCNEPAVATHLGNSSQNPDLQVKKKSQQGIGPQPDIPNQDLSCRLVRDSGNLRHFVF